MPACRAASFRWCRAAARWRATSVIAGSITYVAVRNVASAPPADRTEGAEVEDTAAASPPAEP